MRTGAASGSFRSPRDQTHQEADRQGQDRDEADPRFPVLSISLGDTAVFRIGGTSRKDPTRSLRLSSGDVCRLSGPARLAFHGVDRILPGSSRLVPGGGRKQRMATDPAPNNLDAPDTIVGALADENGEG